MLPKWLQSVRTCLVQKKEETDFGSHSEVRILYKNNWYQ